MKKATIRENVTIITGASSGIGRELALQLADRGAWLALAARFTELKDLTIFEQIIRVNFLGSVYCTFYALPYLKKTKGRLVGICSGRGIFPSATADGYGPSKLGLWFKLIMPGVVDQILRKKTG